MDGQFLFDRGNQLDDELTIIRHPRMSMYDTVKRLGLAANCKLILDAGDNVSYPGSGQVWSDISGQGNNFNLGVTNVANTDDPTFSGSPGIRGSNYFSSDGGDFCRLAGAVPSWMQNLHKDGALTTMVFWAFMPATGSMFLIGDCQGLFAQIGMTFVLSSGAGDRLRWIVCKTGGTAGLDTGSSGPVFTRSVWAMYSITISENGGASASYFGINGTYTIFNGSVTGPSASNASYVMEIMGGGNGGVPAASGSRMGSCAVWEGQALAQSDITNIFNYTRGRYGI
jgi:hypothetical protein